MIFMSERKSKLKTLVIVFLILMALISLTNFLNLEYQGEIVKPAGLSVLIGIAAYFITARTNEKKNEGFNIKTFPKQLKDGKLIALILIPSVINIISWYVTDPMIPGYVDHLKDRTDILDPSKMGGTMFTLIVAALGEEIANRAFFQKQLGKIAGVIPSLIITSLFFALAHYESGDILTVVYDLSLIFINSIFYGLVFKRTDNAWCSWVSHLLANITGFILMYM